MRSSFTALTAFLLLASSTTDAFAPSSRSSTSNVDSRRHPTTRLHALEDLTSKLVDGASAVDMSSAVTSLDSTILMGGGVVLALAAIGAAVVGSQNETTESTKSTTKAAATPEPEPEPIDVSIPYDAAALYAYQQQVNKNGSPQDKDFEQFKQMYYDMSVAEVVLKQKERKLQELKDKMESMYPNNNSTDAVNGEGAKKETVEA